MVDISVNRAGLDALGWMITGYRPRVSRIDDGTWRISAMPWTWLREFDDQKLPYTILAE